MSTLKTKLKNIYFFACSLILQHPNMFIFVAVIFITFLINPMYLEASSSKNVESMYKLCLSIVDEFNQKERIPFGLPTLDLPDESLFTIINLCDSELELKVQLWYILYTITLQYDISVILEFEEDLRQKRIFRARMVISIILLIIISYVFYYYVSIPLRAKYSKRKKK